MAEAKGPNKGYAIGIDLGTTFSCVAVVRNGKVEIIPNEHGNYTTPSFVAFNDFERLIGETAKEQLAANSTNTVFDAKRLIGRKFDDPIVQKDMQLWPFNVVGVNGMPKIEITYKGEVERFSAEEISAMILRKMKEIAEDYLNSPVANAVITVPAYFNDLQRKATKDAAKIAGLNVSRIINEPTAAAIAYGLSNDTKTAKNVLVFDFGGGTFDVSILNIHKEVFEVKAAAGDSHLGGEDFDNRMMETLAVEFEQKHKVDLSLNKRAMHRLRTACERAKRTLSSATHASIEIDSLCYGIDFVKHISRVRFEDMCADLFQSTIATVDGALKDAELKHENIDTILLVGGSTRMPKIHQLLRDRFPGKEICKTINEDEAVAHGAAIQAAILHGNATKKMQSMVLMEVIPLTLGIAKVQPNYKQGDPIVEYMSAVIKRNTRIPVCKSGIYDTIADNQTRATVKLIQGERKLAKDNFEIGELRINGIPPAPAGVEKVTVTFSIDENGILTVSVVSKSNPEASRKISIKNVCGSLTKDEIYRMIADAEMYREQDLEAKQYKTARSALEQYCVEFKNKFGSEEKYIIEKCNEVQSWLDTCSRPKKAKFDQRRNELEALTLPPKVEVCETKEIDDMSEVTPSEANENSENDDDGAVNIGPDPSHGNIFARGFRSIVNNIPSILKWK